MNNILVDSSIWIEYFKGSDRINLEFMDEILNNNLVCTNDLILAELIPFLKIKKQNELIDLLNYITKIPLVIDWHGIIKFQESNLKHGINKVGIPDLIIMQNVINNNLKLYSLDNHFNRMRKHFHFAMI